MLLRLKLVAFLLFTFFMDIHAQSTVKGKIYDGKTDSTIAAVNVYNLNTKQSARSDLGGSYSITAAEGDQLIFSTVGYKPDTITVVYYMLLAQHDVTLRNEIITLKNVTVTSSYQGDSLARRNYYDNMYKLPNITGRNTPQYGFGISLSPFSHFSQEAKQKRQLKKRLIKEEQEYYVDRSFPKQWVASMTGLRGDSLSRFMMLYRPSYSFCRKSSREQMLIYVSEKLKEFKKPK
jgi:hypothetical protein